MVNKEEEYENMEPIDFAEMDRKIKENILNVSPPQPVVNNPLAEMLNGLMSGAGIKRPPSKLTLSGPVGESNIGIEITDPFTAKLAHDIINRLMEEVVQRQLREGIPNKESSEDTMYKLHSDKLKTRAEKEDEWNKYKAKQKQKEGATEEEMFRHLSRGKKLTD